MSKIRRLHIASVSNFIRFFFSLIIVFFRQRLKLLSFFFTFNIILILHIEYVCLWRLLVRFIVLSLYFSLHSIFLLQMFLTCNFCSATKFFVWVHDLRLAKIDFAFLFGEMVALRFNYGEIFIFWLFVRKNVVCLHLDVVFNYQMLTLSFIWINICLCLFDFMKNIVLQLNNLFLRWVNLLTMFQLFFLLLIFTRFHKMNTIFNGFYFLNIFLDWLL